MGNTIMVTMAAVTAAIETIEARGDTVTVRAIHEQIGGGSMTTIAARLREWRSKAAGSELATEPSGPVPAGFDDALRAAGTTLWAIAQADTLARVAGARGMARIELDEARATSERLRDELAEARNTVQDLQSNLRQTTAAAAADREALKDSLAAALERQREQAAGEITQRLQEQHQQHADEISRLSALHAAALQDQKRRSLEAIDKLQKTNQRLEAEVRDLTGSLCDSAAALGRLEGELAARMAAPRESTRAK